ncbi:MAG: type VI secretion system contractile sheath large subunit [Deltaproteobacteria bacterium]|nr:type VI secretion system contractile sheath large subunit [Deltaproteobacteria bacterium]
MKPFADKGLLGNGIRLRARMPRAAENRPDGGESGENAPKLNVEKSSETGEGALGGAFGESVRENPPKEEDKSGPLKKFLEERRPRESEAVLEDLEEALSFILKDCLLDTRGTDPPQLDLIRVDCLISSLGDAMSGWMDAILHAAEFQDLEKTWRSLKFLTDRVDYDENIVTEILNVKKEELLYDLAESPEITRSGIFNTAYTREYGQFGGQPYTAILGLYEFGCGQLDLRMLISMSTLGSLAHTPFLAQASKDFFGLRDWSELGYLSDFRFLLDEPRYAAFRELRSRESSRYLCLVLPGFLARLPYSPETNPVDSWNYSENSGASKAAFSWGHPQLLLALKMAESFARDRWSVNITGIDGGGRVDGLPAYDYEAMGAVQKRVSTQAVIGEHLEFQLSQNGFIPLCYKDNFGVAAFYSANTVLRPKIFGEADGGSRESLNHRVSTMLPYMMIVNRLAHYIKVVQRENIGTWKDSRTLERELNSWINQYVTDMDSPSPSIRAKRPLRFAKVEVTEDATNPGWHFMKLAVTPHFKFIGASFTLNLTGRLDHVVFDGG